MGPIRAPHGDSSSIGILVGRWGTLWGVLEFSGGFLGLIVSVIKNYDRWGLVVATVLFMARSSRVGDIHLLARFY